MAEGMMMLRWVLLVSLVACGCASSPWREARPPSEPALVEGDGTAPAAQSAEYAQYYHSAYWSSLGEVITGSGRTCNPCDGTLIDTPHQFEAKRGETYTVSVNVQSVVAPSARFVVYPIVVSEQPLRYTFTAAADGLYLVDIPQVFSDQVPQLTEFKYRLLFERGEGSPELQAALAFAPADDLTLETVVAQVKADNDRFHARMLASIPSGPSSGPPSSSSSSSSSPSSSSGGSGSDIDARLKEIAAGDAGDFSKITRTGDVRRYKSFDIELTGSITDVKIALVVPSLFHDPVVHVSFTGCPAMDREAAMSKISADSDLTVWGGAVSDKTSTRRACVTIKNDSPSSGADPAHRVGVLILYR